MATGTPGVFDSDEPFDYLFAVSRRIYLIVEMSFWIRFREFTAPAKAASVGGGVTSGAVSTPSGGGSTSGPSSASSSDGVGILHQHDVLDFIDNTPPATTERHYRNPAGSIDYAIKSSVGADVLTGFADFVHTHPIAHTHSTPAHTHPTHDHTVPAHAHGLEYGIFKEPMPATIDVNVGLWHRPFEGGAWQLIASIDGLSEEEQYVDVTSLINTDAAAGLWRLTFQSAPGQPNNGRLTVDVVHEGVGAMASA